MRRIDFLDVNDPSKVVYSYSVAPHQPAALCTSSPTMLLYEDQPKNPREVRWLDCDSSRPKLPTGTNVAYTKQSNIWDMCFLHLEDKALLITTRGEHGLNAYNTQTDQVEWSVKYGRSGQMTTYGVATDGREHIFVCDLYHSCIQVFSFNGKYKGRFPNKDKVLGQPVMMRLCDKLSRLFVVHKKSYRYHITILQA